MVTKTSCCMPKMNSGSTTKWANANSMTFQNYTIENKLTIGSGVGATSRFVQSALRNRAKTNTSCCMFKLNQLSYMRNVLYGARPMPIVNIHYKLINPDPGTSDSTHIYVLTDGANNSYWSGAITYNGETGNSLEISRNTKVNFITTDTNTLQTPLYLTTEIAGDNKYTQNVEYSSNYTSTSTTDPKVLTVIANNTTPNTLFYNDMTTGGRGGTIVVSPTISGLA